MAKKIKVTVDTGATLPISYLKPLQGNLKEVSKENLDKLIKSILKHGFAFPIFVWENKDDAQLYIIDGHTRLKALYKMKDQGYIIPQIPILLIEAKTEKEAKEKLAAVASQYGKFTAEGVNEFFKGFDLPSLDFIDIPFLDFSPVLEEDPDASKLIDVNGHQREIKMDDKKKFFLTVECKDEKEQQELLKRFTNEGIKCKIMK